MNDPLTGKPEKVGGMAAQPATTDCGVVGHKTYHHQATLMGYGAGAILLVTLASVPLLWGRPA